MKNPKWRCAYPNSHKVKFGGKFLTQWAGYNVNYLPSINGSVSGNKNRGYEGDTVTLSNTPNQYYTLDHYVVSGSSLYGGNKFDFNNTNVDVSGVFKYHYIDPDVGETVKIGNQIWMKYNLTGHHNPDASLISQGIYSAENFGTQFYYTWDAARTVANKINGWHLPSKSEWNTLISYIGSNVGQRLKSTNGWAYNGNGTDEFGFRAVPAGYCAGGFVTDIRRVTSAASWWIDLPRDSTYAYYKDINYNNINGIGEYYEYRSCAFTIRLIKDA